jgi:phytol kinase
MENDMIIAITWPLAFVVLMMLSVVLRPMFPRGSSAFDQGEYSRKFLHLGSGLLLAILPIFNATPFDALLIAMICGSVLLLGQRLKPMGRYLDFIFDKREGALWYIVAIITCAPLLRDHDELFTLAFLLMAIADVVAAYIGMRYASTRFLNKSRLGSLAFALTSLIITAVWLHFGAAQGGYNSVLFLPSIVLVSTIVEALSKNGLDNLTVPLSVCVVGSVL